MTDKKKLLFGCGGCSCLVSLLAFPAGIFMLAMWGDSHMSELGPFGVVVTPMGMMAGLVAAVLLFLGYKAKQEDEEQ
jgi:hypothetical protein